MDRSNKNDSDRGISESDSESETKPLLLGSPVGADASANMSEKGKDAVAVQFADDVGREPSKSGGKITGERLFVVASILVTELCERLTYYSVVANMVLFCTSELNFSSDDASVVTLVFSGTVYLIPVIGGYVADSLAGKYNTILGSGLIYVLGLFLLPASAVDYRKWFGGEEDLSIEARKGYFFSGLVLVAIGTGGIKANVGPFGAQQVDDLGSDAVQSFFNWFYWFINAGAVVAYSGVAYVQQEVGFDFGFLIPLLSMIIAIVIFMFAKPKYKHTPIGGSILTSSFKVCCQSINGCNDPSWSHAHKDHGGSYSKEMIEGVKAVLRVIPVFILVIVYWAVYSQMSTSLFLQSERMNISVGDAKLPAAMLNIFNTLIILILIPIMDRIVYPLLAKYGKSPTHLQRIGIGMVLAALAMLYAGMMEIIRKNDIRDNGYITQTLSKDEFNASKLTMFAQIPEFAFIGSSEVFASISGLEFAYTQAPQFMQGLIMGLFLMTSGLGSYLASLIVAIVGAWRKDEASDWFPKEPNNGHLEYLLFLLAALTFINLFIFIFVAKWYKYKKPDFETEAEIPVNPEDVHVYENNSYHDNEKKPLSEYSETSKL
ncbi:solute carrier family 15 member 4-like [Ruditapes philippinarum]|uniref:solute carrier family 15 member 4-like n=1 Tax=Ruditapes philippinarum TaxID=129788 RepID=UPI00295BF322|nr:solute carrier family 15 member 4-like [Ruditapes philippinarum]